MPFVFLLPIHFLLHLAGDGPREWIRALPPAHVQVNAAQHEIVIELDPVDVPAGMTHHGAMAMGAAMQGMGEGGHHQMQEAHFPAYPPVMGVDLPLSGWMSAFRIELVDAQGHPLPATLLHHYNLIDPNHRELFLPISRRVLAAGSETGPVRMSRWLLGARFARGDRLIATAMLHNPTQQSYSGVRTRLILTYTDDGHWWPLVKAYPWQFDVAFPVGDKSFDLPPGRSAKSYEGSPAVAGKIVGIGGHVHDHAITLELLDVTSGDTLWTARPITDSTGRVVGMPIKKFFRLTGIGVPIVPDHRYRVTVTYDNPTGAVLPQGGMGVVAGLFKPASGTTWPVADFSDSLYVQDLRHALRMGANEPVAATAAHSRTGVEHTHD